VLRLRDLIYDFQPSQADAVLEPLLAAAGFQILTADFSRSVYGAYACRKR
jgi:hypothetical protein